MSDTRKTTRITDFTSLASCMECTKNVQNMLWMSTHLMRGAGLVRRGNPRRDAQSSAASVSGATTAQQYRVSPTITQSPRHPQLRFPLNNTATRNYPASRPEEEPSPRLNGEGSRSFPCQMTWEKAGANASCHVGNACTLLDQAPLCVDAKIHRSDPVPDIRRPCARHPSTWRFKPRQRPRNPRAVLCGRHHRAITHS